MFHQWITKRPRGLLMMIACSIGMAGCTRTARDLTVDKTAAREACTKFLTAWQEGKKAADLAPGIVGKDSDWEAGKSLEAFEILPEERSDGANLFLTVRRTVKSPGGTPLQQEVGYVVGTSPVVTVFRSDE
jgi:hypothetical protein